MRLINLTLLFALLCVPALPFEGGVICGTTAEDQQEISTGTIFTLSTHGTLDEALEEDERLRQPGNAAELATLFNDLLRDYMDTNLFLFMNCEYCVVPYACVKVLNPAAAGNYEFQMEVVTYSDTDHRVTIRFTGSLSIAMACTKCDWYPGG